MTVNEQIARSLAFRSVIRIAQGNLDGAMQDILVAIKWAKENNFLETHIWEGTKREIEVLQQRN